MKANPETVKRWKQANRERCNEVNRKRYHKCKTLKAATPKPSTKKQMCACGNIAFRLSSSGYVCERCAKIERKNRKYETYTNTAADYLPYLWSYISGGKDRPRQKSTP